MDAHDVIELEQKLVLAVRGLEGMTDIVGVSRQVKEYNSDQRKNLLARYKIKYRKDCESDSGQETLARADDQYQTELNQLADQYGNAEKHIAKWDAMHARLDALRTAISLAKVQLDLR